MNPLELAFSEISACFRRMEQRHQAVGYKFDRLYGLMNAARAWHEAQVSGVEQPDLSHYTTWKRGDILRVKEADPGDPVLAGDLVKHSDFDGHSMPRCEVREGVAWRYAATRQLEFVVRPVQKEPKT